MSRNPTNEGRAATEADVDEGLAIFFIPDSRSRAYQTGRTLPVHAKVTKTIEIEDTEETIPAGTVVEIIQVELVDDKDILVGFMNEGTPGVCALEEVQLLDG